MMKRREVITLLGAAALAWPPKSNAQPTATPIIGYLSGLSEAQALPQLTAFRRGLHELSFVEDRNIAIVFHWADGQYDRLPAMALDLVRRRVTVIVAQTPPAALAAKEATAIIPIVFVVGFDPVGAGLVASLARPAGNITGFSLQQTGLAPKRLEILRELLPKSFAVAMIINPISPNAAPEIKEASAAAQAMGLQLKLFNASTSAELDAIHATIAGQHPDALLVSSDPFFVNNRAALVALAARLGIPAIYPQREYVAAGGLVSYGTNVASAYRLAGIYAGRIVKGAKPADLPSMQPTTFELLINLKTAKMHAFDIPSALLSRADEVIE